MNLKKVKTTDGEIKFVEKDYKLKDGEELVEEKEDKKKEDNGAKELTMDELKGLMKDSFKDSEIAKDVDDLKEKVKNIGSKSSNQIATKERAEKVKTWVKDMIMNKVDSKQIDEKTITTDSGSFGYTVPTELADAVHEKKDKIAKIRPNAFVFKLSGKFQLPFEGTGVTAYWVTTEADTDLTESNPTTTKKSLDDYYLASRVRIPYKLINTSGVNIENYIAKLSARALVSKEETAFVGGDGSDKPTGIRQASISSIAQSDSDLAYDDLVNLFYGVPEQYRKNGKWLVSNSAIKLIKSLKDNNNNPIFDVNNQTLFNKPLLEVTDIPGNLGSGSDETEIYFGDLEEYWIKDGQNMLAETRKVEGRLQVDMFLYQATDGVLVNTDAFRYLSGVK